MDLLIFLHEQKNIFFHEQKNKAGILHELLQQCASVEIYFTQSNINMSVLECINIDKQSRDPTGITTGVCIS